MTKIISFASQKGGTGKTTTAHAFYTGLQRQGYKVLAIDLDQQCNFSYICDADTTKPTAYELLTGAVTAKEAIQNTAQGDIIAGSEELYKLDLELTNNNRALTLSEWLKPVKNDYDYIIIDIPPAINICTINAFVASTEIISTCFADILSLQGLSRFFRTMQEVKGSCNNALFIKGILLTQYNNRTTISTNFKDVMTTTANNINTKIFDTTIRSCIAVREAQASQQSIFAYAPRSNASIDYQNAINEYLGRGNNNE